MINRIELENMIAYEQTQHIGQSREALQMAESTPSERISRLAPSSKLERRRTAAHPSLYGANGASGLHPTQDTENAEGNAAADSKLLRKLAVGASIEFSGRRSTKRVLYVKSISGQGGVYFFHDDDTHDTILCLTAVRLSQYLREGFARILN